MATQVSTLPVEVELALDVMPCQAMRRSYDDAPKPHACAHFAEWGLLHSYDYADGGPPPEPGIIQPALYAGKRRVIPEILSGCRKSPILAVGINPNLPGWQESDRNAIHPYFDDYLQYAHYFRWRATDKLRIPKETYKSLLNGRTDGPDVGEPLVRVRDTIDVERSPVTMYNQYQRILDELAKAMGWNEHKLAVGEDLAYANMVACGGSRWTVGPVGNMPKMGLQRSKEIINECFNDRAYFPRQLLQSLPGVVIVFSKATADAFIARLQRHFTMGNPVVGEGLESLLAREIRMKLGTTADGKLIDTQVIFSPHASANQGEFGQALKVIVGRIKHEVDRGNLAFNLANGHLARRLGGCQFCTNALYSIGKCDYQDELKPLASGDDFAPLDDASDNSQSATDAERGEHLRLLSDFMGAPRDANMQADDFQTLDEAAPFAPKTVLNGTIATMKNGEVIEDGHVFMEGGSIIAVQKSATPAPAGFANIAVIKTGGVIFPGLADLHNHLAYNILSLWAPKKGLANRAQWLSDSDYKSKVGKVMDVVANRQDLLKALIRYVEAKLLIGGVTSGQGMNTKYGGKSLFRGIIRNFEQPDDPKLQPIRHKITDIQPKKIDEVKSAINTGAPYFLHLAEGTNAAAQAQFEILATNNLVKSNLVGIHSLGLTPANLKAMGDAGAGVVWSPFSNTILYGRTIDMADLQASGVKFSLGSDWTPSGSRNTLGEMKIAWLTAKGQGHPISAQALAEAVTSTAMKLAGWSGNLGTVEVGKYADLTIIQQRAGMDAYDSLLHATEADIRLVVVAGHARYGEANLMQAATAAGTKLEPITIGGRAKMLNLVHPTSPLNAISLDTATKMLAAALADLPAARDAAAFMPLDDDGPQVEIELELDELEAEMTSEFDILAEAVLPQSVPLDPLTVIDDTGYWARLAEIKHLPDYIKGEAGLRQFYVS